VDEHDLRIRTHVYASFVGDGHARSPAETAAELGLPPGEVEAAYRRLHDAHALVLHAGTAEIRMLNPFSVVATPHRVRAGGREWFANCAWDALGIPAALHADGRIESECPDCGQPLELEVRDGELVEGRALLVHFVVPARRWWDDIGFT
jgi:alkylmercury lyase-like protein